MHLTESHIRILQNHTCMHLTESPMYTFNRITGTHLIESHVCLHLRELHVHAFNRITRVCI